MKLTVSRESLLKPLQVVSGVVERRQTLPVLANVLLTVNGNRMSMTGTDLEVELVGQVMLEKSSGSGSITVPARKFFDICKALPENSSIEISQEKQRLKVKSGSSRFTLSTLPANEFPTVDEEPDTLSITLEEDQLRHLINSTSFAMAMQDVRYYLNGMLLECQKKQLRAVATDGHRLAMCNLQFDSNQLNVDQTRQIIVPRKGVLELVRLLNSDENRAFKLYISNHYLRAIVGEHDDYVLTTKLIDGKFPDYKRVLPKGGDKFVIADRQLLKQALSRTSILSNEKFHGIRLSLSDGNLQILATNPEQEEAQEAITVDYHGDSLEIGFNVNYLLDVLSTVTSEEVKITLSDPNSSALIEENNSDNDALYVVMPMRL